MTTTDEILIAANQLANEGKKPSVALIKAKLNKSVPLPLLISTLKGWKHQPDFIALPNIKAEYSDQSIEKQKSDLSNNAIVKVLIQETLSDELKQMKKELSDIRALIENLCKQLSSNSKN